MKIAIIGADKADSMERNLQEAFCYSGYECKIFDIIKNNSGRIGFYLRTINKLRRTYSDKYDQNIFIKLASSINQFNPDLVICVYRFIHPIFVKKIKKNGRKIIHINPDALTTFEYQQIFVSDYDVWFSKDPYIVRFMKNNMHLNAVLYAEAFSPRINPKPNILKSEAEKEIKIEVMTYGTMYPYRTNMLKLVKDAGINLKIYGITPNRFYNHELDDANQHKYITGTEKSKLLYGSKIVFNQMHYAEIEGVNCRFFEVNGAGAFQLSDYRPILHNLLPIDPELVSFKSIDEGIEKIKYYLNNPQERYNISNKIYTHFINNYTYDHLIKYILKIVYE